MVPHGMPQQQEVQLTFLADPLHLKRTLTAGNVQ